MKPSYGFSLIELMIALTIVAIVALMAFPSFQSTVERNRVSSSLKDFSTSVKFARSEAVKQSSTVTICASSDQATCTGNWEQGWIVFTDVDAAGDFDGGTDTLIRVHDAIHSTHQLRFDGTNSSFVTFSSRGYAAGQSGTFKLCLGSDKIKFAKGLVLQATGSLRFSSDSNNDGIDEDASGTNFNCS